MFTHLAATLTGLSTVRAYNAEGILETEFDYHQDTHSACWYMFIATSSAFGLSLDIMCLIFISCIILYYMVIDTNVSGDKVGLAVTQAMSLTGMLQWGNLIRMTKSMKISSRSVYNVFHLRYSSKCRN